MRLQRDHRLESLADDRPIAFVQPRLSGLAHNEPLTRRVHASQSGVNGEIVLARQTNQLIECPSTGKI